MRISTIVCLGGAGGLLAGCLGMGLGPAQDAADADRAPTAGPASARITSNTHKYFLSHSEHQSNGGASVERYRDCDENGVLVGFGGRVNGDGNFTDITAYCRDIGPHGALNPTYSRYTGGTSQEASVIADDGYVAVGVAGRVDGQNLTIARIRQCAWDANTRSINTGACSFKPSQTQGSHELYYLYSGGPQQYKVLTGVGLTASHESLSAIRVTVGELRPVNNPVHIHPIDLVHGENRYYTFEVPAGSKWAAFLTFGGSGDLDLYVKKGGYPIPITDTTVSSYDCASRAADNREACEVFEPGTYYVLLHGYNAAWWATYDVKHSSP